jgi:hypothetical protein
MLNNTDWSANKDDGVCISLWGSETPYDRENKRRWIDTRIHADPSGIWMTKRQNKLRIEHLKMALEEFEGRVDVVLIDGRALDELVIMQSHGTERYVWPHGE